MKRRTILQCTLMVAVTLVAAGCGTWVEVKPAAKDVAIIDRAMAADCRQIGVSKASISRTAGVFARNPQAVHADLVNIARNDAAQMGGNAVAPLGPRHMGHQRFGIYRCGADALVADQTRQRDEDNGGFKTIPYQPPG